MADIPSMISLKKEVSCPDISSKDRYTSKYTKSGFEWCDDRATPGTCDNKPGYLLSNVKRVRDGRDANCGCVPGPGSCEDICAGGHCFGPNGSWGCSAKTCSPGGGRWRSRWGTDYCIATEGIYPSDDATKLKCCSGVNKAIDCHPSYCSGSAQCGDFMKNYCLGESSNYFEKSCQNWVDNGYANREDVLLWASNTCDKMLNDNANITTATDDVLIDWCKTNAKANPGLFDQVLDAYCLNKEQQYETSICACYGGTEIPGATQLVPNACLGNCGLYGYKNNKTLQTSCTIAMCNTTVNLSDIKNSEIELGTLKNACSAQVGDAVIEKTSDYTKQEGGVNPLITLTEDKSMLPEQLVNIGKQLGLDELAKKMNIKFDVLVIMIIAVSVLLLLSLNGDSDNKTNKGRPNMPFNNGYPPAQNYYYR